MADLDVTKKLHVYHLLYRLNLSFTNIVHRCGELEQSRIFPSKSLRRFQGYAQELQAEINDELTETLNSHESHDWYRYGKVRDAYEKYIRDPDDVFINAEERRRQLARQGKKPPRRHPRQAGTRSTALRARLFGSAVGTQHSAKSGGRKLKR